jgi:WD40 repeat protein
MDSLSEANKPSVNVYNYKFLDSVILDKNVDRVKFIKNKNENYILSACYHLDKESRTKSGSLNLNKINLNKTNLIEEKKPEKSLSNTMTYELDYGILDLKYANSLNVPINTSGEKESETAEIKLFTANSDYSFSIFNINFEHSEKAENSPHFLPLKKYKIHNEEFQYNSKETCNALDIKTLNTNSTIILAMNDGCHCLFDLIKEKPILIKKSHEYGLWSCMIKDIIGNVFFTGSEDSLLKMWDRRSDKKEISVNRSHNASINCIQNFLNDDHSNYIVTGSYDETLRIIDVRKFGDCLFQKKIDCSIWDINQRNFKNMASLFLMANVYEGFNVFEFDKEKIISDHNNKDIKSIFSFPLEKGETTNHTINHKTIVYGVDSTHLWSDDEIYVTSCSFYDNSVSFWKIF